MSEQLRQLFISVLIRANQVDPTGTTGIRKEYEREAIRRFKNVRKLIIKSVVDEDVFGLRGFFILQASTPGPKAFDFPTSAAKIDAFAGWLEATVDEEILALRQEAILAGIDVDPKGAKVPPSLARRVLAGKVNWQSLPVEKAYTKGVATALARAQSLLPGAKEFTLETVMNSPFNRDRLQALFSRNFEEMKGVTRAMDQAISRELTEGLAQGQGPRQIASRMAKKVDGIGLTRARVIARTEIIRANAEASLNTFEFLGIKRVTIKAELRTIGDLDVCKRCRDWERRTRRKPITIKKAKGIIPVHPNCRCTWVPVIKKKTAKAPGGLFSR